MTENPTDPHALADDPEHRRLHQEVGEQADAEGYNPPEVEAHDDDDAPAPANPETPDEAPEDAATGDDDDAAAPEVADDPDEPAGGENDATDG